MFTERKTLMKHFQLAPSIFEFSLLDYCRSFPSSCFVRKDFNEFSMATLTATPSSPKSSETINDDTLSALSSRKPTHRRISSTEIEQSQTFNRTNANFRQTTPQKYVQCFFFNDDRPTTKPEIFLFRLSR